MLSGCRNSQLIALIPSRDPCVMDRLNDWLGQCTSWKVGMDVQRCRILVFKYEGIMGDAHLVQLVDMGLPNDTHTQWHTPVHADRMPMKSAHPIQFEEGKYYSVLGPGWKDGVLWVTGPHFDHGCCRVAQDISDVTQGWIELFCGGMGSWSFAASKLHKAVHVAVDNDPVACTGYRLNHGVVPFCCSVGQAIWVPSEPREGIMA